MVGRFVFQGVDYWNSDDYNKRRNKSLSVNVQDTFLSFTKGGGNGRKFFDSKRRIHCAFAHAAVESKYIFRIARGE